MDGSSQTPATWADDLLRHENWLRGLVAKLVDDPGTADDVVQQTWLAALQRPPRGSARAFLRRVARNLAVSTWRAEHRRKQHETAAARDAVDGSTAEALARVEMQRRVAQAVAELPEPDRSAVLLRHVQGLSPRAIATELGVPSGTVRQRCHRGLDRLRQRLERELGREWRVHPGIAAVLLHSAPDAAPPAGVGSSGVKAAACGAPHLILTYLLMNSSRWTALAVLLLLGGSWWLLDASTDDSLTTPELARIEAAPRTSRSTNGQAGSPPAAAPLRAEVPTRDRAERDAAERGPEARPFGVIEAYGLDGTPLPGCRVRLAIGPNPPVDGHVETTDRALEREELLGTTDAFGVLRVRQPETAGHLRVSKQGHVMVFSASFGGSRTTPERSYRVVLAPEVTLRGRVVNPLGEPLAGVQIRRERIELSAFPHPLEHSFRVRDGVSETDDQGAFVTGGLPAGAVRVHFEKPSTHSPFAFDVEGPSRTLEIVLQPTDAPARYLTGHVTGPGGGILAGARIEFEGRPPVESDARGAYRIDLTEAHHDPEARLWAARPGLRPAIEHRVGARLQASGATRIDLQLTSAARNLRGRLMHADGSPVSAGVHVYPWEEPCLDFAVTAEELAADPQGPTLRLGGPSLRAFGTTDAEGRFTVPGLGDQPYRLRVLDRSKFFCWTSEPVRPGAGEVELRLPPDAYRARVAGRVVSRDGQPIAFASISQSVKVWSTTIGSNWQGRSLGTTDRDGRFEFENLPRHELQLAISGDAIIATDRTIEPGEPADALEIVVARRCYVRAALQPGSPADRFSLLDADGNELLLTYKMSGVSSSSTSEQIANGSSRVVAVSDAAATAVLFDALGDELARLPIRLSAGGQVYEIRQ